MLRSQLEGPALADKVASFLNKRMRGRIAIGSINWPVSGLKTAVTGGWVPIELTDVRVWDDCALGDPDADPEQLRIDDPNQDCTPDDRPDPTPGSKRKPRRVLLATPRVTAEIDIHAALFGNHDIVARNVRLHGGEALIEQTREPYPLHAYNRTIVSIVSAFYPRMKAGFRAGIYADSAPPIVDLRDVHVEGLDVTVHAGPYTNRDGTVGFRLAARVDGVDVDADASRDDAYLYMDGRDPLVQKFYVRVGARTKAGKVRILDSGPRDAFRIGTTELADWGKGRKARYALDVSSVEIRRLAMLPTEWARHDYVANSLDVDATVHVLPCKRPAGDAVSGGTDLHIVGGPRDFWDHPYDGKWDFRIDTQDVGDVVRSCIKSTIGGEHLGGRITLSGPFVALPRVDLDLHGLDVDIPLVAHQEPLRLSLAQFRGFIDLVNDQGAIDQTQAIVGGGVQPGAATVSATFGLTPLNATAALDISKPIDVGRFLPTKLASSVGRFLTGKLKVGGDIDEGFEISDFDVALGATPTDRSVELRGGRIFAKNDFDHIEFQRLRFNGGKSNATINGAIDDVNGQYVYRDLEIQGIDSPDLKQWLARFGLPPIAASANGGTIILNGPVTSPTINVRTTLQGVPCIGSVRIEDSVVRNGLAEAKFSSTGLGGAVIGNAFIDVKTTPPVLQTLHVTGNKLDASRLCQIGGTATGTIDTAELELHGAIDPHRAAIDWAPLAKLQANAQHLVVHGDAYTGVAICLNRSDADDARCRPQTSQMTATDLAACIDAKQRNGACAVVKADRVGGGRLEATIANVPATRATRTAAAVSAHLGGALVLDDVPMAILDPYAGRGMLGGLFSAVLHLQGELSATRVAPQATGAIDVLRGWVNNAFTGDSQLQVDPVDVGKMRGLLLRGSMLAGQLGIVATLGSEAPYPLDVSISGRRVEVDQFLDLGKLLGIPEPVQAWASGTVTLHVELEPVTGVRAPEAWVELTELEGIVDHRSRDGRHAPLRFAFVPRRDTQLAASLRVTPSTVELACRASSVPGGREACPARLETPAGIIAIEGAATATQMSLTAHGDLDLGKLAALAETQLDAIRGVLTLDGHVTGNLAKPSYALELAVKQAIAIRPVGADADVEVGAGSKLDLANGALAFTNVTVKVKDQRAADLGALTVHGTLGLDGFAPALWDVKIEGQIAGKLLQLIAPQYVAQAAGVAQIDGAIALAGRGRWPLVTGALAFGTGGDALSLSPRGVRRDLALVQGRIEIKTDDSGGHRAYTLAIPEGQPATVTVDGEGRFENIRGQIVFRDNALDHVRLVLDAENVPYRSASGLLDLTVAATDVELGYDDNAWRVRTLAPDGFVSIVNGTFKRNFELAEVIKPAPAVVAPARTLWEDYPSIGNAVLDLRLDVRRFAVDDNIAKVDFEGGGITISGSPRDPRLQGSIRVGARGEFTIPATRARFTRTTGSIDFTPVERATNPALNITSDAPDYLDLSGQSHVITMVITGTLEQPVWDLHTNTGLDKSQTIALIFLGRSPEQLRRSLGDQSLGSDPMRVDPTTNPSTGVSDQLVKDIAGDWVSGLFAQSLTNRLKTEYVSLDVLRFELGFGSIGVHAEIKAFYNLKVLGDVELTVNGSTLNPRVVVNTPFHSPLDLPLPGRTRLCHACRFSLDDRLSLQFAYLSKLYNDPAEQALDITDYQGKLVYRLFIP